MCFSGTTGENEMCLVCEYSLLPLFVCMAVRPHCIKSEEGETSYQELYLSSSAGLHPIYLNTLSPFLCVCVSLSHLPPLTDPLTVCLCSYPQNTQKKGYSSDCALHIPLTHSKYKAQSGAAASVIWHEEQGARCGCLKKIPMNYIGRPDVMNI